MDIRQLEYFAACCEQGSFNKAAACLYTTQPNVSKVISSLESWEESYLSGEAKGSV